MQPSALEPNSVSPILNNTSLANRAYEAIREAIITGRIKPGERMGQVELAKNLGVSERTVREAFARLVAKGLAVHEPYKGVRVAALPLEDLRDVYNMRALLEGHAIELAVARITEDDLDKMRELLPLTSTAAAPGPIKNAQEANRDFHWIPIRAAGSRILAKVLEQLWEMMFAYDLLYQDPHAEDLGRNDFAQHIQLLEALEARDGKRAAEINKEHIEKTLTALLDHFVDQKLAE